MPLLFGGARREARGPDPRWGPVLERVDRGVEFNVLCFLLREELACRYYRSLLRVGGAFCPALLSLGFPENSVVLYFSLI